MCFSNSTSSDLIHSRTCCWTGCSDPADQRCLCDTSDSDRARTIEKTNAPTSGQRGAWQPLLSVRPLFLGGGGLPGVPFDVEVALFLLYSVPTTN